MKTHTTNYSNTFIEIADDCPTQIGEVPPLKGDAKSVAYRQFELINNNPYLYSSDDVLFQVYSERNNIGQSDLEDSRIQFFSKGQPCFRASPLTKRYGWGVHSDKDGKIAIFGKDSKEYQKFKSDDSIEKVKAMKSSR